MDTVYTDVLPAHGNMSGPLHNDYVWRVRIGIFTHPRGTRQVGHIGDYNPRTKWTPFTQMCYRLMATCLVLYTMTMDAVTMYDYAEVTTIQRSSVTTHTLLAVYLKHQVFQNVRTRTKYRLSMAQTTYVEHMPMLYDQRGCDYTYDYSSDVSSPASSSASPQHSPLLSDDEAAHHWFLTNPVEVTYSGYHINEPAQEYTPLAPMDSSCLHYVDPRPEVEMHMPRAHPRGSDALKIEKLENQVFAVFGRHRYSIDPEDKFDASNCYTSNVAKSVVTHTAAEESVSIFYPQPPRRTQGTRSKRLPRAERLWEFILRLLLDPSYNPSHIEWVDREKGMFRLVNSRGIARMWGKRKNNLDMTYEKLSRAMRYYYHRKILQPVFGKKLVYKFGPNSTGWQLN